MITLCGLYRHRDVHGRIYYSGRLGGCKVLLFQNRAKNSGRQPDLRLYLAPIERGGGDLSPEERAEFERLLDRDELPVGADD